MNSSCEKTSVPSGLQERPPSIPLSRVSRREPPPPGPATRICPASTPSARAKTSVSPSGETMGCRASRPAVSTDSPTVTGAHSASRAARASYPSVIPRSQASQLSPTPVPKASRAAAPIRYGTTSPATERAKSPSASSPCASAMWFR